MRNLTFFILSLLFAVTAMADVASGAPLRANPFPGEQGTEFHIYQRSNHGSATNPVTHTSCVPQDGTFELVLNTLDKKVYIKNLVYGSEREFGNYWVEGKYNDTTGIISIPVGQVIYQRTASGKFIQKSTAVLVWGTVSYDATSGNSRFTQVSEVTSIDYQMEGNTIHIEHTSGPVAIEAQDDYSFNSAGPAIVWTDEDGEDCEWAGYCEWGTEVDMGTPYVIDWQPEGELKTYTRTSDCIYYSNYSNSKSTNPTFGNERLTDKGEIVFANDGKTVYMKDPFLSMKNDTWVKGTLEADRIIVELPQCLYKYDDTYSGVYMKYGFCNMVSRGLPNGQVVDAIYASPFETYSMVEYLIEGNTITLQGTECDLDAEYPLNYYATGIMFYDSMANKGYVESNIVYVLNEDTPVEPTEKTSAPVITGHSENNGHAYCVKVTPSEPSTIYVRTLFSNGYSEWAEYSVPFWFTTPGEYRVEAYAKAEGKLPSDPVSHNFEVTEPTSINETVSGKQVVNTRYYNAMGQELQQPNGMTIIVTTYSDGSTTAVKVMK